MNPNHGNSIIKKVLEWQYFLLLCFDFFFILCFIPADVAEFLLQEFFSSLLVPLLLYPTACVQYLPHIPKKLLIVTVDT